MELGLKFRSAARHNDELEAVLAVVTELPFVLLGLLAVALRLHVYGIIVRKGPNLRKLKYSDFKNFLVNFERLLHKL
jgi:hypothetical protein